MRPKFDCFKQIYFSTRSRNHFFRLSLITLETDGGLPAEVVFTLAARPKSLKLHFRPSHACNRELTGGRSGPEIWEWGGGGLDRESALMSIHCLLANCVDCSLAALCLFAAFAFKVLKLCNLN